MRDIYHFNCRDIDNRAIPLEAFRNQVMLIVNTASYCGFTPQYKGLEDLYRRYKKLGFVVLGFPSNQFFEEPNENEQIYRFCVQNYGVSFPLFAKTAVNGKNAHPLFNYLQENTRGIFGTRRIKWNFTKFLINREGQPVARFAPTTFPSGLAKKIEPLL